MQRGNQSGASPRDFPAPPEWAREKAAETIGSAPIPIDEMAEWLGGAFTALKH